MSTHAWPLLVGVALVGSTAIAAPDTGRTEQVAFSDTPFNLAPHRTWRLRGLVTDVSKGLDVPAGTTVDVLVTFDSTVVDTLPRGPAILAFHALATPAVHVQIGDGWLQSQQQSSVVRVLGTSTAHSWTDWALPALPLDVVRGRPAASVALVLDLPALQDDPELDGLPAEPIAWDGQAATATLQVHDGTTPHTLTVVLHTLGSDDDGDGLFVQHEAEWGSNPTDAACKPLVRDASASLGLPDDR